jgi:hypothetical protein
MFSGLFFSSDDPGLEPHVRELDARVAALFPEFTDGRAAARLRLHHDEFSGRGVSLADGLQPTPDTALALYYGCVVAGWPTGDYVLALPSFRRDGRSWHPSVDASARCRTRRPTPLNAAMFNHTCHNATVALRRPPELRDCPLPCAVAYPTADLRPGGPLLWDYDGGARHGNSGFSVDLARSLELRGEGIDCAPCSCRGPVSCPRARWFRVSPIAL